MADITEYEAQQVGQANASKLTPVVFIHGLWLLPSSWDRWRAVFEEAGYTTLAPGWPDDPSTVADANRHPEVLAHKSVGQIADHFGDVIGQLTKKSALIGHSFGGLITQILAGRAGLGCHAVPIGCRQPQPVDRGEGRHQEPRPRPLLIIDGAMDHTVPWAVTNASFKRQKRNPGVTEIVKVPAGGTP